jgi:hypothetical protein
MFDSRKTVSSPFKWHIPEKHINEEIIYYMRRELMRFEPATPEYKVGVLATCLWHLVTNVCSNISPPPHNLSTGENLLSLTLTPAIEVPSTCRLPAPSLASTAYPSLMEAGNGGRGSLANTSSANTRPRASV